MISFIVKAILFLSAAGSLSLLIFVLSKKYKQLVDYLVAIILTGIFGWSIGILTMIFFGKAWTITPTFLFPILGIGGQLWFIKIFPENKLSKKISDYWSLPILIILLLMSFFPHLILTDFKVINGAYIDRDNGPFGKIYSLMLILMYLNTLFIFLKKNSHKNIYDNTVKKQLKIITMGFTIFFFINILTNSVLPAFFGIYFFNAIGPIFSLALIGSIYYVIKKYHFLDIRFIIQKSLVFSILLTLVISTYLILIFISSTLLNEAVYLPEMISAFITASITIITVPKIRRYFTKITDKFFYKDRYVYSQAMHKLSEILNINIETENIINKSEENLKNILRVTKVKVILFSMGNKKNITDENYPPLDCFTGIKKIISFTEISHILASQELEENKGFSKLINFSQRSGYSLFVPVILQDKKIGMLLLGDKLSGDDFLAEDINLLKTFSNQAAVALEKARLYDLEKSYAMELEKKVKLRTKQIQDLQEEQRQMMLDISHELQTPLTVTRIEIETIKKQLPENKAISSFEKSIDWISKFISDLLELAHLEMSTNYIKKNYNLSKIITDLIEYFEILTDDKKIVLINEIEPNIVLYCDEKKIRELVINLMSNAVKYIANERRIYIYLTKKQSYIELIIKDTGLGINKDNLSKVFKRFYMERKVDRDKIKGSGLGLAICKKIVEEHNGQIKVESEERKYTKFIVKFKDVKKRVN